MLDDVLKKLSTTTFAYFDEVIVNESATPRIHPWGTPETLDTIISNFEAVGVDNWLTLAQASMVKIENPDMTGGSINASDSCIQLGDSVINKWAWIEKELILKVPVSACYLHVMAKSTVRPNLILRTMPDNATNINPIDTLIPDNTWQDLVYEISAHKLPGYDITSLRFLLDLFQNNLNNTDSTILLDNIIINSNATPRTSVATSLKALATTEISIYPNPASDRLNISGEGLASISIYNAAGQMIMQSSDLDGGININRLQSGIFFINCKDTNGKTLANKTFIKE